MPDKKRKEKPSLSIIGAGRLGTTLAVALNGRRYPVQSLVARDLKHARKAAALLDGKVQAYPAKKIGLLPQADLFLISTPDDQIASVAAQLSRLNYDPKPTALHTSGALSSEVLSPLRAKGWSTGSVHPLISVSSANDSIEGAFWSVEGDRRAVRLAKALVRDLGGTSFSIRTADKPLYHAAAVMTSGNVTALFDVALEMLVECGLTRKTARRILQPLLVSTVHNLETKDPAAALTGTFSRGDVETVKRHLAALKDHDLEAALKLYRLLGERSLKLSKKHPQLHRVLADGKF
ncbi:MAG TPA: Rossmann-like and DUF2520 domain-containing protein [Pyrinomonadaceae bacterium]|nr:Rossmann-like and DUF2520 domain-containing protein [Pyrinomonadaceae bacterium]